MNIIANLIFSISFTVHSLLRNALKSNSSFTSDAMETVAILVLAGKTGKYSIISAINLFCQKKICAPDPLGEYLSVTMTRSTFE